MTQEVWNKIINSEMLLIGAGKRKKLFCNYLKYGSKAVRWANF